MGVADHQVACWINLLCVWFSLKWSDAKVVLCCWLRLQWDYAQSSWISPGNCHYARFPAFRNATQRNATQEFFYASTEKCCVLFTQPQTPQRRLRLFAALCKQIQTTNCIFPQRRRRTGPIAAAITFNQWMRHCGTARCVKKVRCGSCGIAVAGRYVALWMLENAH